MIKHPSRFAAPPTWHESFDFEHWLELAAWLVVTATLLLLATPIQAAPTDPHTGQLLLSAKGEPQSQPARQAAGMRSRIAIEVSGMVARVKVTQQFKNPTTDWLEGVYVFPLPENAAVDRMRMQVGDRILEGQVKEKAVAKATYVAAAQAGKKAALVEERRPNLFSLNLANVGPGETVDTHIEYLQTLRYEAGRFSLRFPLAVTPRYKAEGDALTADAGQSVDVGQPLAAQRDAHAAVNYPIELTATIDAGVPLREVVSSYHEATFTATKRNQLTVSLTQNSREADRDFELSWQPVTGSAPQAAIFRERVGERDYALVMVMPPSAPASAHRLPREMVLILDTSGSMSGTSIVQARAAARYAIDRLRDGDRFNIIEFNSVTASLFPAPVAATTENLDLARRWVDRLNARGGTEMSPALAAALSHEAPAGFVKQVIFLTDGAVGNEAELFSQIERDLKSARLFTVGIGSAPNSHFMSKAAELGRGTFTFIGDVTQVEQRMATLINKLESPLVKDVSVRWPHGDRVEMFPNHIPDLYAGEPVVFTIARDKLQGALTLAGQFGNQPWSQTLTLDNASTQDGVSVLWARSKVAALMDEFRRSQDASIRTLVIELATQHRLVTPLTSFVAVDVTPSRPSGEELRAANIPARAPGELPRTATLAQRQIALGALLMLIAGVILRRRRHTQ